MKKTTAILALMATVAVQAAPIDITTPDHASNPVHGFNGGPFDPSGTGAFEDNETEAVPGLATQVGQKWDMEALTLNGSILSIVGGYNMNVATDGWKPGDLFIKVGGAAPGTGPLSAPGQIQNNQFPAGEGYTFAVNLSDGIASGFSFASVYSLTTTSLLDSVNWDGLGSNPWRYASGAAATFSTGINYSVGQTAANVAALTGVGALAGLKGDASGALQTGGAAHNVLQIDLSFLSVPIGTTVYFSYVMECGNDAVKGEYGDGFTRVPDRASNAVLLGIGLAALSLAGLKRRKV
jgi:hypothetical protein